MLLGFYYCNRTWQQCHWCNNHTRQYAKGQFVVIKFDGPNYNDPTIISAHKAKHPVLGTQENFDQSRPYVIDRLVKPLEQNFSSSQGDNGCFNIVVDADDIPGNGESKKKHVSAAIVDPYHLTLVHLLAISEDCSEHRWQDWFKICQWCYGELFSITGYIQVYEACYHRCDSQWYWLGKSNHYEVC